MAASVLKQLVRILPPSRWVASKIVISQDEEARCSNKYAVIKPPGPPPIIATRFRGLFPFAVPVPRATVGRRLKVSGPPLRTTLLVCRACFFDCSTQAADSHA